MLLLIRWEREFPILETSDGPIRVTLLQYRSATETVAGIDASKSARIIQEELFMDGDERFAG